MSLVIYCSTCESESLCCPEGVTMSLGNRYYLQPSNVVYDVEVRENFALCCLKQTYNVSKNNIVEALYQFPVDDNSAFCDLEITTPRETVRGLVKSKTDAHKIYSDAKAEGKQAFLSQQHDTDRDILQLNMCNLLEGDEIKVRLTYITEITNRGNRRVIFIPSFISHRYKGKYIPHPNHGITTRITINDRINNLKCSVPDIDINFGANCVVIKHSSAEPLEQDIEITFDTDLKLSVFKFHSNGYTMAIAQFMVDLPRINSKRREIVFVIDCSGSMQDDNRIVYARQAIIHCLNKIRNTGYRFNIIRYGSTTEHYLKKMVVDSDEDIDKAIKYCEKIEATLGGTETFSALAECLSMSQTAILLTDGDTSDNRVMHNFCSRFNNLSVLGIGSGINRANVKDMARIGGGISRFSQTETSIVENVDAILNSIIYPSVKNPVFNWLANPKNLVVYSPVVSHQTNTVYALLDNPDENIFQFYYNHESINININSDLTRSDYPFDPKYLGCLVARRIIQTQEDNDNFPESQQIDLAVKFNIISEYTSLVAVSNLGAILPPEHKSYAMLESVSYGNNTVAHHLIEELVVGNFPDEVIKNTVRLTAQCDEVIVDSYADQPSHFCEEVVSDIPPIGLCDTRVLDIHYYKLDNLEAIRAAFETGFANMNREQFANPKLFDYYDSDSGLFAIGITDVITGIPDILFEDFHLPTLFILYCLQKFNLPNVNYKILKEKCSKDCDMMAISKILGIAIN